MTLGTPCLNLLDYSMIMNSFENNIELRLIMQPSSLGGAAYCVALCPSVCLSVRPVMSVTSRHLANYNDTDGRITYGHLGRTNLLF